MHRAENTRRPKSASLRTNWAGIVWFREGNKRKRGRNCQPTEMSRPLCLYCETEPNWHRMLFYWCRALAADNFFIFPFCPLSPSLMVRTNRVLELSAKWIIIAISSTRACFTIVLMHSFVIHMLDKKLHWYGRDVIARAHQGGRLQYAIMDPVRNTGHTNSFVTHGLVFGPL